MHGERFQVVWVGAQIYNYLEYVNSPGENDFDLL